MSTASLHAVGGSVVMALPKRLLELVHLQAGSKVEIGVEQGRLKITPQKKPRYKLADLMAQCDPRVPLNDEELEWMNIPTVGLGKEGWGS